MAILKLRWSLLLMAFFPSFSSFPDSKADDCFTQQMLYGRPCNRQPPPIFNRPTFIQMKFPGDSDVSDFRSVGQETSSGLPSDAFLKILREYDDKLTKRFDDLEKMLTTLNDKVSQISDSRYYADMIAELGKMQKEIREPCGTTQPGPTPTTIMATTTITPDTFTTETLSTVISTEAQEQQTTGTMLEIINDTSTVLFEREMTNSTFVYPSMDDVVLNTTSQSLSTDQSATSNHTTEQSPYAFLNITDTNIGTSNGSELTPGLALDFKNDSTGERENQTSTAHFELVTTPSSTPPTVVTTEEEDTGVWVYVRKPAGNVSDTNEWVIDDTVTLPSTSKPKTRSRVSSTYRRRGNNPRSKLRLRTKLNV